MGSGGGRGRPRRGGGPVSILIRDARILTLDGQDREFSRGSIRIEGSRIAAVAPELDPGSSDSLVDGRGKLVMPGLVNGHFHSPGSFNRGAIDGMPLELFMLFEVPPFDCPPTSPRLNYVRTLLGAVEMLKHGVTAVHDDPFYVPRPEPELIDAVMQAYADSGIRATVTINEPNVIDYTKYPFLEELLPEELLNRMRSADLLSDEELLSLYESFLSRWHGAGDGRLRCAVSCSAPQRVHPGYLQELADLARRRDLPYDMHILETRLQRVLGDVKYGTSLIQYVDELGVLDERSVVIHAIWVDEADMDLLAERGTSVVHNPVCNLRLGSGVMPFRALSDRGIPICLGSDEMCSDDAVNMWTVLKVAGLVHTITDPDYRRWPRAPELLRAATVNGARAMRLPEVGALKEGNQADLVVLDLDTLPFTPLNDLRRQLVYAEPASTVERVMVAGRWVVEEGGVLTVDEGDLIAEVRELMADYVSHLRVVADWAERLEPIYREMYRRAAERPVPMNRWVSGGAGHPHPLG